MKKILSGLLLTILLVATFLCPLSVSADSDDWVLGPDAKFLTHSLKTYYPIEFTYTSFVGYDMDWEWEEMEFADQQTETVYGGSAVYVIENVKDIVVEVELYRYGIYDVGYYVEESYYEEFSQLKTGAYASYKAHNFYDMSKDLTADQYETWRQGAVLEMTARDVENYDMYLLYGCDSHKVFQQECGIVLRDRVTDALYLLDYSDYDRTYFYAGGTFATDHDGAVKVYKLEDDALRQKLIALYDTVPEEELDWLVPTEPSANTTAVVSAIFFGVLPGAIMAFAVVMLILVKQRQYRLPFIILLCAAAMVLIAYIVVCRYL